MAEGTRTYNSARNILVGVVTQALLVVLSFASRAVFVAELGVELLGLNALFMSVLAVLAITDLGLNSAVMFALYAPLSDKDHAKVGAIVQLCANLYRYVAAVVSVLGLCVLPFLANMTDVKIGHLHTYYLMLLLNSVLSYLLMHRVVLLNADQRLYLTKLYSLAFSACRTGAQIWVLLAFQSYFGFILLQVAFTVINNVFAYWRVGRLYPYLRAERAPLGQSERRSILIAVRAMLIYRIGGAMLNNTDPILISIIVGTATLGYYSNYLLVVGSIVIFTDLVFASIASSVGHLIVNSGVERRSQVFDELHVMAAAIFGGFALVLGLLLSDFIRVWLGAEFILDQESVMALILNFYLLGSLAPVATFRTATGMFSDTQYVFIVTAFLNLGLSLAFGQWWGLPGILWATAVSRLLTQVWFEPFVLIRKYLEGSLGRYYWRQFALAVLLISMYLVMDTHLPEAVSVQALALKATVVGSIILVVLAVVLGPTKASRHLIHRAQVLANRNSR